MRSPRLRSLRFALVAASLIASTAFATILDPKNGAEFVSLATAQPVQTSGKKVEVIEFFMYHCPHCNVLEPELAAWVKKQGDNIAFRRVHLAFAGPADPKAHLYLTLEAMGKIDMLHEKVFHAIHVERMRMNKDDEVIDWVSKNGIDKAKFLEYWNSFGVLTKLKRIGQVTSNYSVDSAPTLIVDGRFMTSPSIVGTSNPGQNESVLAKSTMQVMDGLVAKVQKDNGVKPAAAAKTAAK